MVIRRTPFFLTLLVIAITPFFLYKILWIAFSEKTTGTMGFVGRSYTGQIGHSYSVISFVADGDTLWFNSPDNIFYKPDEVVPVRYYKDNPSAARVDQFVDMWGDTVVYGGILALLLLVIFLHPAIVPRRAKIHLNKKRPFVRMV